MIKLVIFDLDGVLVDARELHYESLNNALRNIEPSYVISRAEHLSTYDGMCTKDKLNILTRDKGLPKTSHDEVWKSKQEETLAIINNFTLDDRICELLKTLKSDGYQLACGTNSIRDTAKLQLIRKGFMEHIDYFYSNQDVTNTKPHPEIYMRIMLEAGVSPKETLIVEDSHHGRKAAIESGAFLCPVKNSSDLTLGKVKELLYINSNNNIKPKWQGDKMNVLIPMAGLGSRFAKAGYTFPKPLIEVNGKPMIQVVTENLNIEAKFIYIVQKEHYDKYNLKHLLQLISPGCEIVQVDGLTEGAACTTLLAKQFIDNDEPLLMANSDQFIDWNSNEFMYSMIADEIDGGILTFKATHPKWSFAKLDENGYVTEVAEKKPISDLATVGVYYWKHGKDYVKSAEQMINKDIRTNGEFYVCPVFNEAIANGKQIKTFNIKKMWGLGTPEDLNTFLNSKEAV